MKKNIFKLLRSLVSIVVGIVSLVGGSDIVYYGDWIKKQSYGGDAYTGIQNAAASTADNVYKLGYMIDEISLYFFLITGLAFIGFGVIGLIETIVEDKKQKSNIPANEPTEIEASIDKTIEDI